MAKRIIKGKAYNTETATRLGFYGVDEEGAKFGADYGQALYQNRFGAFFLYDWDIDGQNGPEENITPLTAAKAKDWLVKHQSWRVDLIESLFGEIPEAGSRETKYTLRMPNSLHQRITEISKSENVSLNAWIVRALEEAAKPKGESPLMIVTRLAIERIKAAEKKSIRGQTDEPA